jgi:hypothetical protein
MRERGLFPSVEADRFALIRRVALDLTGLPPRADEVTAFVNDLSQNAYEKMVADQLAKPAYGERWASAWLDQARYADSAGYAEDRDRNIWAYRDYVIRSFNDNKPFDQFTIEQLAGDLLPQPTTDQLVASAFHRNTLTNSEGGTIDEEFRSAAVVDRTNTTLAVWMGTTIACAQCHSHKYDPFTQREYFQLYAFFNTTSDNDQPDESPTLPIYSPEVQAQRDAIEIKIRELHAELEEWNQTTHPEKEKRLAELRTSWEASVKNQSLQFISGKIVRIELPGESGILSLAEVDVISRGQSIAGQGITRQSSEAFDAPPALAIDGNTDGNFFASRSVTHTNQEKNPWWEVEWDQEQTIDEIIVWNRTDGRLYSRNDGLVVSVFDGEGQTEWSDTIERASAEPQRLQTTAIPHHIFQIVQSDDRSDADSRLLADYFQQRHDPAVEIQSVIQQLTMEMQSLVAETTVPIMREQPVEEQRKTFVHHRGDYLQPTEQVSPDVPAVFHRLPSGNPDRLALARWLVDPDNPLTARVTVNRIWQQLFGVGLVSTSEEFGTQGEPPTHPELLDYLACEFMESGWDIKHILKQIVCSATYRQSSKATAEQLERDPTNRWLARGPRVRLTAEMIRDQALHAAGMLSAKMYGPPVHPPQPKMGLKFAFRGESADWIDSVDEDRTRRAVYTFWRRSSPYPSLTTFDVSNRDVCELRRLRTNTPLQALVTLNDPVFIEAAQGLARRVTIQEEVQRELTDIARKMFRLVMIREPNGAELSTLVDLYRESHEHFRRSLADAKELANDPLNPVPDDTDWPQLAAWTTVANVVLNLDETFLKR